MTKKKILSDHKKRGKKLVPPLSEFAISDFSYVTEGIPQIIWYALLNKYYGLRQGTDLASKFGQTIDSLSIKKEVPYHLSWFSDLNAKNYESIKKKLKDIKVFDKINIALSPLLNLYPNCPLNNIFISEEYSESNISDIKEILILLYDKRGKESTFALANVMYLMGMCKKLHIVKNSALADLPELVYYPDTEKSKMIASGIRASTNFLLSPRAIENNQDWVSYFWNRGLEIEPNEI
ncbi:hypothetical protein SAMN05192545_0965 [Maribacter dokdonensis]|uniref:Uncharacterized protein n=1 Tax=Maribacter dokdonensis TaxID=320912 RepID=A0ABY0U7K9_9FLAO|nr:hypothetical protein [Maribacter dokdonensis]SDS20457.1 hypothetical protein SAMN05192545_0965 [Maribacter dokdonensis]